MTDKQIIIDGVDVSECECYSEHREGYCGWHIPCEGDICPYKLKWALQQLKRKEQECEELRQARKDLPDIQMPYVILYRQTKAQCYKLEQELQRAEQKLEKIKEIVNTHKQNRCIACSEFDECFGHPYCDEIILKIIEE